MILQRHMLPAPRKKDWGGLHLSLTCPATGVGIAVVWFVTRDLKYRKRMIRYISSMAAKLPILLPLTVLLDLFSSVAWERCIQSPSRGMFRTALKGYTALVTLLLAITWRHYNLYKKGGVKREGGRWDCGTKGRAYLCLPKLALIACSSRSQRWIGGGHDSGSGTHCDATT